MPRRQAYRRQGENALLGPMCWLVLLVGVAASIEVCVPVSSSGVFPYHCQWHGGPGGKGMSGVVKVVERIP